MRDLKFLPHSTAMLVQLVLVIISMLLVDISHSSDSASAFSSADKVTKREASPLSSTSSLRHKRTVTGSFFGDDSEEEQEQLLAAAGGKPGWGKRFYVRDAIEDRTGCLCNDDDDQDTIEKRAPGWGKRAPGWGKRAPGWGKRAPGWGKRAPGWGKRAPGWGKRAPGWGKRSTVSEQCERLDAMVEDYTLKAKEAIALRQEECGNQ